MTWWERLRNRLATALAVQGIASGKPGDGLAPMGCLAVGMGYAVALVWMAAPASVWRPAPLRAGRRTSDL